MGSPSRYVHLPFTITSPTSRLNSCTRVSAAVSAGVGSGGLPLAGGGQRRRRRRRPALAPLADRDAALLCLLLGEEAAARAEGEAGLLQRRLLYCRAGQHSQKCEHMNMVTSMMCVFWKRFFPNSAFCVKRENLFLFF